jgi:nucleoside-diphosphate-sugar epimerase
MMYYSRGVSTVLVTGAAGFVGVNIVRTLAARGHQVVGLDHRAPDAAVARFLGEAAPKVIWVRGDVRERDSLVGPLRAHGVQQVVHGAAVTATLPDWERDRAATLFDVNVMGTLAVLDAARAAGARRVVVVGSGAAVGFGPAERPVPEDAPAAPSELYGISKLAAERIALRLRDVYLLDIVAVRMAAPYGPMERPSPDRAALSPVAEWVEAAAAGRPIEVASLDSGRDWIYVEDAAQAYAALVEAEGLRHALYNLGPGVTLSAREVIGAIRRAWPKAEVVERADAVPNPNLSPGRLRGPLQAERLRDELGFHPRYDIAAGIARYAAWIAAGRGALP